MRQEKTLLTAIGNVAPEPGSYFETITPERNAASYATADEIMADYRTGRAAVAGRNVADSLTAAVNAVMDPKIATLLRELAYIRQGKIQVVPSLGTVPPARILRKYHKQMRKKAAEHKSDIEDIIMDQARYLANGDLAGYVSERQAPRKGIENAGDRTIHHPVGPHRQSCRRQNKTGPPEVGPSKNHSPRQAPAHRNPSSVNRRTVWLKNHADPDTILIPPQRGSPLGRRSPRGSVSFCLNMQPMPSRNRRARSIPAAAVTLKAIAEDAVQCW